MASGKTSAKAEVIVIGSGVAGALVAYELAKTGKSVAILEAGKRRPRWEIVERFRNQADKYDFMQCYPSSDWAPHPQYSPANHYLIQAGPDPYHAQYIRMVGGTTWHWAASAWRFLPNDFKLKSIYGVGRDWPIQYADLEPYYDAAERALGVWGNQDYASPRSNPYPMQPLPLSYNEQTISDVLNAYDSSWRMVTEPVARNSQPYDGRPICGGSNNCMPICPLGAMYNGIVHVQKAEQAGAQLITQAVAYRLEVDGDNRIAAVWYRDAKGTDYRVEGDYFVLAANGIETPKLMLMSTSTDFPTGVGNSSDQVGRNLMDHPGTGISFYADRELWPGRGPQEMTSLIGFRDGDFRKQQAGKKLHLSNIGRVEQETRKIFAEGKWLPPAQLQTRIRDRAARYVQFDAFHEILPSPDNRIVPSKTHKDALGIAQPEIHYRIDDYVKRSASHTREIYADIAKLLGGTEITFNDVFQPNNHITGTTLMGDDPKNSVVDKYCRTHDHANLYIAGSSVMPTVGTVNVTLTLAALALRLADQLKQEM